MPTNSFTRRGLLISALTGAAVLTLRPTLSFAAADPLLTLKVRGGPSIRILRFDGNKGVAEFPVNGVQKTVRFAVSGKLQAAQAELKKSGVLSLVIKGATKLSFILPAGQRRGTLVQGEESQDCDLVSDGGVISGPVLIAAGMLLLATVALILGSKALDDEGKMSVSGYTSTEGHGVTVSVDGGASGGGDNEDDDEGEEGNDGGSTEEGGGPGPSIPGQ